MKGETGMTFAEFKKVFQENFKKITENVDRLYEVDVDKDYLWNLYLDSFPAGTNEIFRKRREYDCSCCRHFIKQFGNVVVLLHGRMVSIWDFETGDTTFQPVIKALSAYIHSRPISDVYYSRHTRIGVRSNFELTDVGADILWEHFSIDLDPAFVETYFGEGDFKNMYRTRKQVFERSLKEISVEAIDTVLELIESNSLYRGGEWKFKLQALRSNKNCYDALIGEGFKDIFCWEVSPRVGDIIGRIRNHSIGVLLTDISEGMDLEQAVRRYEQIVAPSNYKRPKAIFTKRMLEEAQKKVVELGYMNSLPRRHARLNDISVNNILFCNRDVTNQIRGGDVFAEMMKDTSSKPTNFDRVEEIGINDFIENVLPNAREVEVYLENRHQKNMVSLIAPQNADAPSMFKWNNDFGWAYAGNVTDSLKENVKAEVANAARQQLMELIASKKNEALANLSIEELEAKLKELE